jgi:uncharacterized protein (TIGR03083 family)
MPNAEPSFQEVLTALKREDQSLRQEVDSQPSSYVEQDSFCSEWKNYQVISHLGSGAEIFQHSLEAALDGKEALTPEGRQAIWGYFDGLAPQEVYPQYKDRVGKLIAYLEALPESKQNEIVPTFAGNLPLPKAVLMRLNEMALHVWDLQVKRDPSTKLDDKAAALLLPMVVDRLPNRAKREGLDELRGRRVGFDISGAASSQFTLTPGTEQASVEQGLPANALFTVKMSAEAFERLVSGREPIDKAVTAGTAQVSGDTSSMTSLNKIFSGY